MATGSGTIHSSTAVGVALDRVLELRKVAAHQKQFRRDKLIE
jgi:hypothetical protein